MLRLGLVCLLAALASALSILPEPGLARPSFRPAFTGGPFRIVIPAGRPHAGGPQGIGRRTVGRPIVSPRPAQPAQVALHGDSKARPHRFRRFDRWGRAITVDGDWSYYGTPYDPSDAVPDKAAVTPDDDDTPEAADAAPQAPEPKQARGCRAERIVVPAARDAGESEVTIVRC